MFAEVGRCREERKGVRLGTGGGAIVVVLLLLLIIGGAFVLYEQSLAPKAAISISFGNGCSPLKFQVTNQDTRILHGWQVTVQVSPAGSHIVVSPSSESVEPLGPQGEATGSFTVDYSGAPVGAYQLTAQLVNGTQAIATSNSIGCTLK